MKQHWICKTNGRRVFAENRAQAYFIHRNDCLMRHEPVPQYMDIIIDRTV